MKELENQIDSVKELAIIVNAREYSWTGKQISFEQLVVLSFGTFAPNSSTIYTITYAKGPDKKPGGSLVTGDVVDVKDKMVFNVTATSQS